MQIIHLLGMTFAITFIGVTQSRECTFIDVRNKPSELKRLEGCTAVLGFLQIMLIDHATPEDFEQYSFPELREVTGFFMLYRVFGLLSVRKLFPNLSIIRGNELLMNYAFIMHEMMNITEVGLPSLQTISRGNARIQRCPRICDADTFNWQKITNSSSNFFYDYGQRCTGIPKRVNGPSRRICNLERNQTECFVPVQTKPKEIPLNQCHELCLIGCHNTTARGCYACKGPRDAGVCVDKCPDSKIYDESYMRCLTRTQCRSYNKFIFEEKLLCVSMCPKGYIEQDSKNNYEESYDHKCYPCEGLVCPKVCLAADINYVEDAYKLHGCQIISGSIHININIAADRPELMDELTKYLGSIEEIYGFLKIYRSYPITSLDFLKNLRVIHGTELQNDYFALFVYDNNNLQGLWKPRSNFEILNGSVLFSSNDKLCPYVVQQFLDKIGQNATKVNLESNGGRSFCNSTIIDVKSEVLSPTKVTVFWEAFTTGKDEGLVGYLINYVESMDTNVTHFYGTYSCTVTAWNTQSVKTSEAIRTDDNYLSFNLTHLNSMTQYAFYVRTNFEGSNYRRQGQSPIRYFKTPVHALTQVLNLRTFAKASTSITLQWNVIPKERAHINFYTVDILRQPDDQVIYSRDFCQNPQENSAYEELQEMEPGNEACCCGTDKAEDYEAQDVSLEEDDIIDEETEIADVTKYKYYVSTTSFMPNQTNGNRYEITGLKPYTLYSFQFFACMSANVCSGYSLHSDRTRPDSSDMVLVNVHQDGERNETIIAEFDVKNETNGAVVGYVIHEKRKEEEDAYVTDSKCFSLVQNSLWNHTFSLPAGVIQLRFQAITLAGLGPFTDWFNITVLEIPEKPSVVGNFLGALFLSLFICGSVYGTIWFKHNRHRICKQKPPVDRNDMEMLVFGIQNPNVDDELLMDEIPLGNVHFEEADFY